MKSIKLLLGLALTSTGALLLISAAGIIDLNFEESLTYILLFFGFAGVALSFGGNSKSTIFLGSSSFFWGIIKYVISNYEILNSSKILLPAILFILGGSLLILFLDSPREFSFLLASLMNIGFGIYFTLNFPEGFIFDLINGTAYYLFGFWPFFLVVLGVLVLTRKSEDQIIDQREPER